MKMRFTMIELLLILSVVSLALMLAIPAVSASQDKNNSAACADQSRKLGAAFASFAQNNDGFLPKTQLSAAEKADNLWVLWTFDMIRKKFITAGDLICPEGDMLISDPWARKKVAQLKSGPAKNTDVYSYAFYGYNVMGAGGGQSGESQVKLASLANRIILTTDSWEGNNYSIARYIGSSTVMDRYVKGRGLVYPLHDGSANVLWSDGSVSLEKGADFPHETWKSGVFSVRKNWVPGK